MRLTKGLRWCVAASLFMLATGAYAAGIYWNGSAVNFDNTGSSATDTLIPGQVAFRRGISQGLFNAAVEPSFSAVAGSPVGTQWAVSGLGGNPAFSVGAGAGLGAGLIFSDWASAYGGPGALAGNILSRAAVLRIPGSTPAQDIYIDIAFTRWGQTPAERGAFAYTRSTPPPALVPAAVSVPLLPPPALLLLGVLLGGLGVRRHFTRLSPGCDSRVMSSG